MLFLKFVVKECGEGRVGAVDGHVVRVHRVVRYRVIVLYTKLVQAIVPLVGERLGGRRARRSAADRSW